jgi:hypothetical protein
MSPRPPALLLGMLVLFLASMGGADAMASAPSTATGSPWSTLTREANLLVFGYLMLNDTETASDEACARLCSENKLCKAFCWCPTNQTSGCGIPDSNGTFSSTMKPGSCITTYDDRPGRWASFVAYGEAVPFISGVYRLDTTASTASPAAAPAIRRLLQASSTPAVDTGSSVWANYTRQQHRYYRGVDDLAAVTARTDEECASACNADSQCGQCDTHQLVAWAARPLLPKLPHPCVLLGCKC